MSLKDILQETRHGGAILLEDNAACISVLQAGYSPKLRSMNRTHRISVAALSEALELNLAQLADLLAKALNKASFLRLRDMIRVGYPPVNGKTKTRSPEPTVQKSQGASPAEERVAKESYARWRVCLEACAARQMSERAA